MIQQKVVIVVGLINQTLLINYMGYWVLLKNASVTYKLSLFYPIYSYDTFRKVTQFYSIIIQITHLHELIFYTACSTVST